MSSIILFDVECYKECYDSGMGYVKELAIACTHSDVVYHWVYSAPRNVHISNWQRTFVYRNIHGIPWESGSRSLDYFHSDLNFAMDRLQQDNPFPVVSYYCKGVEKSQFFDSVLNEKVENLENLSVTLPPISALNSNESCNYHDFPTTHCSLLKAINWRNILRENNNIFC